MPEFKYKNCNPYPVTVPGKRGIGIQFGSGQGTNDPWFGRFCGKGQLTNMETSRKRVAPKPVNVPNSPPQLINRDMLKNLNVGAEEENRFFKKVSGIYHCKLCDIFRTGSQASLEAHMIQKHQIDIKNFDKEDLQPVTKEADPSVEEKPVEEKPVEKKVSGTTCPHCHKTFKSPAGLKRHIRAKHPNEV